MASTLRWLQVARCSRKCAAEVSFMGFVQMSVILEWVLFTTEYDPQMSVTLSGVRHSNSVTLKQV